MEILKCYQIVGQTIREGLEAKRYDCIMRTSRGPQVALASIVAYPLFPPESTPLNQDSRPLAPMSLTYLVQRVQKDKSDILANTAIVLGIDPAEWISASINNDFSILLDPCGDQRILLLGSQGGVLLKNRKQPSKYLIVNQQCKPQIISLDPVQTQLSALTGTPMQPKYSINRSEFLRRKLSRKAQTEPLPCKRLDKFLPDIPKKSDTPPDNA